MALSCFLLPPGICLTSEIIHCHQLREYYFIRIFCSIFYDYLESRIIHLVYKYYTALSVNHMMTSPFIIEKFEPFFPKYHYMSYSYIALTHISLYVDIYVQMYRLTKTMFCHFQSLKQCRARECVCRARAFKKRLSNPFNKKHLKEKKVCLIRLKTEL